MSERKVQKWYGDYQNDHTNVHNEERSGKPNIQTDGVVDQVN